MATASAEVPLNSKPLRVDGCCDDPMPRGGPQVEGEVEPQRVPDSLSEVGSGCCCVSDANDADRVDGEYGGEGQTKVYGCDPKQYRGLPKCCDVNLLVGGV